MGEEVRQELCRLVIPFDLNRTNPNKRHARDGRFDGIKRRQEKNALIAAARLTWKAAGRPRSASKVRYSLIVRRGVRCEDDNAWAAFKSARDALFCGIRFADDGGAITPNDDRKWVEMGSLTWETGLRWKGRPEIVVIVETL